MRLNGIRGITLLAIQTQSGWKPYRNVELGTHVAAMSCYQTTTAVECDKSIIT